MAQLLPPQLGKRTGSNAERKLAERFKRELPEPATVMHSVGLVRHRTKRWAEADFVLVCRAGIFCLEVKGGRVARRNGIWEFTRADGKANQKAEGPFDQAGGAAGALQAWLKESGVRRDSGAAFQVGYGVMIPDDRLTAIGPDIEPEILFDLTWTGRSVTEYVEALGAHWQSRLDSAPLDDTEISRIVEAIRPDFDGLMHRRLVGNRIEEELLRLTEDQERILKSSASNERLFVEGGAGTGKTVLATLEAQRFVSEGKRTLFLCSTRALASELRRTMPAELQVETTHSAQVRLVRAAGLGNELDKSSGDRDKVSRQLRSLAERAADIVDPGFDALIVDEGQDVLAGSTLVSIASQLKGKLDTGTWRIFSDPNQSIFGPPDAEAMSAVTRASPARLHLLENCRNTQEIAHYVSLLSGSGLTFTPVAGPPVHLCKEWDGPEIDRVRQIVDDYVNTAGSADDIAILTHSRELRDQIAAGIEAAGTDRSSSDAAYVSTVAAFKGQEARVVILAGLPTVSGRRWAQTAYVGASRAKAELHIVLPRSAAQSVEQRILDFGQRMAAAMTAPAN